MFLFLFFLILILWFIYIGLIVFYTKLTHLVQKLKKLRLMEHVEQN